VEAFFYTGVMRRRKLLFLVLFLLVAAAIGLVVYRWIAPPPRAVRLLPEGNFLLYVNFSPAHFLDLGQLTAGQTEPEYQDFLQQTGFHFEKDLDTFAISQRNPGNFDSESAAVFTGHFDQTRLSSYLKKRSRSTELYADKTIFLIDHENHLVRVCLVNAETVAVTNMPSPEPMHGIIDRSRNSSLGKGPYLAESYYHQIPFASLAWVILRVPPGRGAVELPGGITLDFLQNTTAVISLRYTGSIRVRADLFSQNDADAAKVKEAANTFVVFTRGLAESENPGGTDKDVKAAFDSIQVQQSGKHTVISVVIPQEFVKKMAAGMQEGSDHK
jgi:hypothetical protein